MKKTILIIGGIALIAIFGLQAYFAFTPPPKSTLEQSLAEILPSELPGWKIQDEPIADTPESSARVSDFLDFDDAVFRSYEKDKTKIGLYVAYWTPGKTSYRWAGAHTPDTCWVLAGWECSRREYSIPFQHEGVQFQPAEYGIYETKIEKQHVYFWHLVGNEAYGYKQQGVPNVFASLIDIRHHGLNLRKEQFFIRLSSNQPLDALQQMEGFAEILDSLAELGLAAN